MAKNFIEMFASVDDHYMASLRQLTTQEITDFVMQHKYPPHTLHEPFLLLDQVIEGL